MAKKSAKSVDREERSDSIFSPFMKKLAANDRPTRDAALESLTRLLSTNKKLDENDFLKLWRALYFCVWFSDRPLTQQRLTQDLGELVLKVHDKNWIVFLDAFWAIMKREWETIDRNRIDKYMLLVRRFVNAPVRRLEQQEWNEEQVKAYNEVISKFPMNPTDGSFPNELRYHFLDIYVDEIEKSCTAVSDSGEEEWSEDAPIGLLMNPIEKFVRETRMNLVKKRASQVLEDERLAVWGYDSAAKESQKEKNEAIEKNDAEEDDSSEDSEWGGID